MNGLRAVKALTDLGRKSKVIIKQGAGKDGCQENTVICLAVDELRQALPRYGFLRV